MPPTPPDGDRTVDLIDELCDYLANGLGMTMGSNFFNGMLPEPGVNGQTAPDGIYIVELPGPAPDMYIDTETHIIDIWASSSDSHEAKTLIRRIYDILERKQNYTLHNWYVYFSYANATIRDEDRGPENNKLFSQSFTLICRNLNNIS